MPVEPEKEYYQYLNKVKSDCELAAGIDKSVRQPDLIQWAQLMFDKAASPYHYWKEAQLLKPGEQPKPKMLTDKQKSTIDNFLDKHEELWDELKGKKPEELTLEEASKLIGDWMNRFVKK